MNFYKTVDNLKHIKVLNFEKLNSDHDIGKIIISTANTSLKGYKLAKILREKYSIETEMCYTNYVLAMTSICDSEEGLCRLSNALIEIDNICSIDKPLNSFNVLTSIPERMFISSKKSKYKSDIISFNDSKGRISLEYVWAYPPGIPLLVPGEIISKEIFFTINNLIKENIEIYSSEKNLPQNISVAEIDWQILQYVVRFIYQNLTRSMIYYEEN